MMPKWFTLLNTSSSDDLDIKVLLVAGDKEFDWSCIDAVKLASIIKNDTVSATQSVKKIDNDAIMKLLI